LCLLLQGDFASGWQEYQWRWKTRDFQERGFSQPLWEGEKPKGQTILLHAEQGFGDTIHFIRFARLIAERGGRVMVECQEELIRLLRQIEFVEQWIPRGRALPPFDLHCPMMNLPLVFGTTLRNIPGFDPPLVAPAEAAEHWRRRVGRTDSTLNVGLAWSGNPGSNINRDRSVPLELLQRLGEIPGVRLFSLQKGDTSEQANIPLRPGISLTDMTADLHDFADTAGLIAQLDLIISVDTSVTHLAAAMGKPVWLLVSFSPEWRWMLGRPDSPWYPSLRIFRQSCIGNWSDVIENVATALASGQVRS
jgi:Glycosyltransferase family 9 (heptosyltransferase)